MEREVVIARYNEELAWTEHLDPDVRVMVYNKSAEPPDWGFEHWENLPNTGREAQTYFHHVITKYDRLAEVTLFTQGDPFPHSGGFVSHANDPTVLRPDGDAFRWLSNWTPIDDKFGHPNQVHLPVGALYEDIFGRPSPDCFEFGAGACFAVRRDLVWRKPQSFYEHALHVCEARHPEWYPWQMERLWGVLFQDPI